MEGWNKFLVYAQFCFDGRTAKIQTLRNEPLREEKKNKNIRGKFESFQLRYFKSLESQVFWNKLF